MDEFVNDDSDEDLPVKKKKRRKSGSEPEEGEDGEKKARKKKRWVGCEVVRYNRRARHEILRECVRLHSRPHKGGREDDSDEEEGSSQPKKQRKPKDRKKIAKVHPVFFSLLLSCVKCLSQKCI